MTTRLVPRHVWPADHQRAGEPMGHRCPPQWPAEPPPRVYPPCTRCGAWVLWRVCEFCSQKKETQ